jgi:hypothetical protein
MTATQGGDLVDLASIRTALTTVDSLVDGISLNRSRILQVELDQHTYT